MKNLLFSLLCLFTLTLCLLRKTRDNFKDLFNHYSKMIKDYSPSIKYETIQEPKQTKDYSDWTTMKIQFNNLLLTQSKTTKDINSLASIYRCSIVKSVLLGTEPLKPNNAIQLTKEPNQINRLRPEKDIINKVMSERGDFSKVTSITGNFFGKGTSNLVYGSFLNIKGDIQYYQGISFIPLMVQLNIHQILIYLLVLK